MFRSRLFPAAIACTFLFTARALKADAIALTQDGKSSYVIVLGPHATPAEKRGARELQSGILNVSGARLPVCVVDSMPHHEEAILVGPGPWLRTVGIHLAPDLGADGFVLRTVGRRLIIAGPGPRGTLYGCTTFLERLGVRWFTPTVTRFPHQPSLSVPELNQTVVPAFEYRDILCTEVENRDWAARLRLNGQTPPLNALTGGKIIYASPSVHSFDDLVPRSLYAAHPEYFPLINGKRTNGYVQRCLSNPAVLKLVIANVRRKIESQPQAGIFSVSQNDTYHFCQCDKCQAIAARYGGQSGLYLWFVNQVADAIAKDHPDKLIDTLAYQFTEAPPTGIVPRKNVRVRLCPISCCAAHPYESCASPRDRSFMDHLRGWAKLTNTLYIWHYGTDFAHYLLPFPDFGEFPADFRLYKRSGVKGIYLEGAYGNGGGGSDAELRCYVAAHLMWDSSADPGALVEGWMKGVYGKAWHPMMEWFNLLQHNAADPGRHFFISSPPSIYYLAGNVTARGDVLFDQAEKLAAGDAVASDYVAKSRLWLQYAELMRHPEGGSALDRFIGELHRRGIGNVAESKTTGQWERQYRARVSNRPRS